DGDDTFTVSDSNSAIGWANGNTIFASGPVTLTGGGGSDRVTGSGAWDLTAADGGTLKRRIAFSGIERLDCGTRSNDFRRQPGVTFGGTINAAGASNTMDYSAFTTEAL